MNEFRGVFEEVDPRVAPAVCLGAIACLVLGLLAWGRRKEIGGALVIGCLFVCVLAGTCWDFVRLAEKLIYRHRMQILALILCCVAGHMVYAGHLSGTDFLLIAVGPLFSWIQGRGHAGEKEALIKQLQAVRGWSSP